MHANQPDDRPDSSAKTTPRFDSTATAAVRMDSRNAIDGTYGPWHHCCARCPWVHRDRYYHSREVGSYVGEPGALHSLPWGNTGSEDAERRRGSLDSLQRRDSSVE